VNGTKKNEVKSYKIEYNNFFFKFAEEGLKVSIRYYLFFDKIKYECNKKIFQLIKL